MGAGQRVSQNPQNSQRALWLVLPYHPDLAAIPFKKIMQEVREKFQSWFIRAGMQIPELGVAWRNNALNVGGCLRYLSGA